MARFAALGAESHTIQNFLPPNASGTNFPKPEDAMAPRTIHGRGADNTRVDDARGTS